MTNQFNLQRISPVGQNFFFGYYDKTPWNNEMSKLAAIRVDVQDRVPVASDIADIGFFDLNESPQLKWVEVAKSRAWNFQQGNMLQWLDNDRLIFNDFDQGQMLSKIVDVHGQLLKILPKPIYSLCPKRQKAYAIDFSALSNFRIGYGYAQLEGAPIKPETTGCIVEMDLSTGDAVTLVKTSDLLELGLFDYQQSFWVDHILPSPSGHHFVFLLRTLTKDGGMFSRLLSFCMKNKKLDVLLKGGMASHASWRDDHRLVIWARQSAPVSEKNRNKYANIIKAASRILKYSGVPNFFRRHIYGDKFLEIDINSKAIKEVASGIPVEDGGGHFSFNQSQTVMINDTYPNQNGVAELMLYDCTLDKRTQLVKLKSPSNIVDTPWRCDFHPRWSPNNKMVCIDSFHEESRGIYFLDLSQHPEKLG